MDITWFSDGATHYAYVDKTYTGYWVVDSDGTARLHRDSKPLEVFSQLAHAQDAAETEIKRYF